RVRNPTNPPRADRNVELQLQSRRRSPSLTARAHSREISSGKIKTKQREHLDAPFRGTRPCIGERARARGASRGDPAAARGGAFRPAARRERAARDVYGCNLRRAESAAARAASRRSTCCPAPPRTECV